MDKFLIIGHILEDYLIFYKLQQRTYLYAISIIIQDRINC